MARVQRAITYLTPRGNRAFIAFDIMVDGVYVDLPRAHAALDRAHVPYTPVVFSGVAEDVVAWARVHAADPVNPAWYGVSNLARGCMDPGEGWVVRPVVETANSFHERVMMKIKNPSFAETNTNKDTNSGKAVTVCAEPPCPVTQSRVHNVLTKELESDLRLSNVSSLADKVVADFLKDTPVFAGDVKVLKRGVAAVVRAWLTTRVVVPA